MNADLLELQDCKVSLDLRARPVLPERKENVVFPEPRVNKVTPALLVILVNLVPPVFKVWLDPRALEANLATRVTKV